MASDPSWKAFERRVAKDFGSVRTALSGGNSKVTRSDTHHPKLFVECKHNQRSQVWTLYLKTRTLAAKERKTPVVIQGQKNYAGYLLVIHCDDVKEVFRTMFPKGIPPKKKKKADW